MKRLLCWIVVSCFVAVGTVESKQPNIILLLADDAGIGDYQPYHQKFGVPENVAIRTPNVQKLAEQGMLFNNAHCTGGVCQPSRYSIITGVLPIRKNVSGTTPSLDNPIIERDRLTIGKMFQQAGYHTGMIGKSHLDYLYVGKDADRTPTTRRDQIRPEEPLLIGIEDYGFDEAFWVPKGVSGMEFFIENRYIVRMTEERDYSDLHPDAPVWSGHRRWQTSRYSSGETIEVMKDKRLLGDVLTDKALEFIERSASEVDPFFLYFALVAPHAPHLPAEHLNRALHAAGTLKMNGDNAGHVRQQMVYENDIILGQVMEQLRRLGIEEETIVIFTSDNGPGVPGVNQHGSAGIYRGNKGTAWEAGNRVPMIIKWPSVISGNCESEAMVSQVDFIRTFADIAGHPGVSSNSAIDSESFYPVLIGKSDRARKWNISTKHKMVEPEALYLDGYFNVGILREDNMKLLAVYDPKENAYRAAQLYDLNKDVGETTNLLSSPEYESVKDQLMDLFDRVLHRDSVDHHPLSKN